jgi:hypothetical protein
MSILQKLTEGVQSRNVRAEGDALLNKWEATGLLEGLDPGQAKQTMAVLLENQAKELLREASSMAAGDVEGFAAVAFPIVRRVFGGLVANDLVSVQPMSLPSGLIFFLDFTHSQDRLGFKDGASIYGGRVVGSQLTGGVNLTDDLSTVGGASSDRGAGGFYNLGSAGAAPTGSATADGTGFTNLTADTGNTWATISAPNKKLIRFDADIVAHLRDNPTFKIQVITLTAARVATSFPNLDKGRLGAISGKRDGGDASAALIRRLTQLDADGNMIMVFVGDAQDPVCEGAIAAGDFTYPIVDEFTSTGVSVGAIAGVAPWGLEEPTPAGVADNSAKPGSAHGDYQSIPEIDIKVDSIAVTAQTKKLKAKWTPELGQDLNAYHNLDAEVELTGILSEQIALEIDRELLGELVEGATAGTRYWSRAPGLFVDSNGAELGANTAAPDFTGTVSEWYETLIETINDVSAQIHRKTLRGGANFVVCSPEVANILEFTSGFRASVTGDQDRGTIGAVKSGSLSKKFDVYVDPYFLRNVILIGRKGSSFLESGFVYAPYVPLQVTPTIFGTEDFVPRKGVMTRYAKKMVRPDMYGLVVVRGLLGEQGSAV